MRVLLTGATGFVGRRVLGHLIERGDEIQVLALPDTIDQVTQRDRVRLVVGDVTDPASLVEATREVEVVYHLAAIHFSALVQVEAPADLIGVNVRGTENVLRAAVANLVRRIVFVSSVAVYQPAPWPFLWPINEDFALRAAGNDNLRNYAQSKIEAEDLVRRFHQERALEYAILRSSAVYGAKARWVEQNIRGLATNPWRALSHAGQTAVNQWVQVDDLAQAIISAGTGRIPANTKINIAGGELFSQRDLLAALAKAMGHSGWMGMTAPLVRNSGNYGLRYDLTRAQAILGYVPRGTIGDGLREILAAMDPAPQFPVAAAQSYAMTSRFEEH
jgi:nucleoside-diphosphate-sugar epimerase